jgi:hypothetical protein
LNHGLEVNLQFGLVICKYHHTCIQDQHIKTHLKKKHLVNNINLQEIMEAIEAQRQLSLATILPLDWYSRPARVPITNGRFALVKSPYSCERWCISRRCLKIHLQSSVPGSWVRITGFDAYYWWQSLYTGPTHFM